MVKSYKSMSDRELKQYLLENRHDRAALRELKTRPSLQKIVIPSNTSEEDLNRALKGLIDPSI